MVYPDTIKLATTTSDVYGDKTVTVLDEVSACFIKRASVSHDNNADSKMSDATVYLMPTNAVVLAKKNELEGMYIICSPFSNSDWYMVTSVNIAERKLLDNAIENIYCRLKKVAGLPYVYIS